MADNRRLLHAICAAGERLTDLDAEHVEEAGLRAICSRLDEGADDADPAWLAAAAQRHHALVQQLFEAAPVLPIRFGTLVNEPDLAPLLEDNRTELTGELQRLGGLAEWGVKILADPDALSRAAARSDEDVAALDAELAASTPGRGFLLKRQREGVVADAVERRAGQIVEKIRTSLEGVSIENSELPLPAVMPAGPEMLANLAFLVRNGDADAFAAAADGAARSAEVEVEISGPWAPYSFVRLNLGAAGP